MEEAQCFEVYTDAFHMFEVCCGILSYDELSSCHSVSNNNSFLKQMDVHHTDNSWDFAFVFITNILTFT